MKKKIISSTKVLFLLFLCITLCKFMAAQEEKTAPATYEKIGKEVERLMAKGDIPGLSLVIVKGNGDVFMKGYGFADVESKKPVTPGTVFELGSCSKAFTGLAALQCREKGLLNLDDPLSKHFPWFYARYKGKKVQVTLKQFLNHTSGIPFKSISLIPESSAEDALQQTIKKLEGIELSHIPGTVHEYATINYDVIGAVIEAVSGMSYEDYIIKNILTPLEMNNTVVGVDKKNPPANMATGYKLGFFTTFKYDAPVFRGNTPAGYILSNGKDMARWLKIQMGLVETELAPLVRQSHQTDDTMPFNRMLDTTYTVGWRVYVDRLKRIDHPGTNPNFTSFIVFNPVDKIGICVLANSGSNYTSFIATTLLNYLEGDGFLLPRIQGDNFDKGSSVVSLMICIFILAVFAFLLSIFVDIARGKRKFVRPTLKKAAVLLLAPIVYVPYLIGINFIPRTLIGVSMDTALVFAPVSFKITILLVLVAMGICYMGLVLSNLFPHKNKYIKSAPMVLVVSLLAGGANAIVIFLITTSIFSKAELFYQLYNFGLAFLTYIIGRKVLQTKLIRITFSIIFDLRMKLLEKVFYTSFQKFEKIPRGRVFATLNDDTGQIGGSANIMVQLVTSSVTTLGAFMYLATIAFWATAITLFVIAVIATLYSTVTRRTQIFFEEARDTRNVYLGLLNGMIDGFKELSLQYLKKKEYKKEIGKTVDRFRKKSSTALIKFLNAFLIGESLLIVVLGLVGYGIPRLFPQVTPITLMAFVMVLLYLIGPINAILNSIPAIVQLRVAWNRIQGFIKDVPANMDPKDIEAMDHDNPGVVTSIEARDLKFTYEAESETEKFIVGPMDFSAKTGEIVFIIGGNGSGKTTLAKLLTGLYLPEQGTIKIDGKEVSNYRLGEYFSVVFGDYHLFEKLYNVDLGGKEEEIQKYIKLLRLEEKVALEDDSFSTIELSGGQRKRLALLQCYLEDRPIYLFDEIAADQDPGFRKFFYRELLQKMKEKGKIIIAITHDDHYFDVADRIVKMDMGKIDVLENNEKSKVSVTS